MAELENNKKIWTNPEIYTLEFRKTKDGFYDETYEDDEYLPLDPSGGL